MDQETINQLEELIQKLLKKALINVVTKDDLKQFATKNDLINLEKRFEQKFATKDELKKLVTKEYFDEQLKKSLEEQAEDICEVMSDLFAQTDEIKAPRSQIANLEKRVDRLEHKSAP
jgi:polyhydroxyalkanoate synthesis regulator phasin